jgi:hypothetical protein
MCADWFVATTTLIVRPQQLAAPTETCQVSMSSDLPGVRIEIDDSACRFTLAEASAGLTFKYWVVVDEDVANVLPAKQDAGGCAPIHASGLYLGERITGDAQSYCVCDSGLCPPDTGEPRTLAKGRYLGTFAWDGHNWSGPSDTGNPKGPLFPAGVYTLEVKSTGMVNSLGFQVKGTLQITLE